MLRRSGVLATLILALTVTPAYATTVTLRVEGKDTTIFEGPVVTGPKTIEEDGSHACDGTRESNGGETDQPRGTATTTLDDGARVNGFSWDGTFSEFGSFRDYFVTRIGGDTQKTDLNEFWGFARNYELPPVGGCQQQVFDGDEVLWAYDIFSDDGNFGEKPRLRLSGPASASVGETVTYRVIEGPNGPPVSGATINSNDTGPEGQVKVRLDTPGLQRIKASKSGTIRSNAVEVCVTSPAVPECGPRTLGVPGAATGAAPTPPRILSPRTRASYRRGPRLIRGTVQAPSGLSAVSFSLRRASGGRCSVYLARAERFSRPGRCRASAPFTRVGDEPEFSYLLPRVLPAGSYVLRVRAVDRANRESSTSVRFVVRR